MNSNTTSRYDSTNWRKSWKNRARASAVNRGIEYIERISLDIGNFEDFGDQVIQLYYDIATVSGWNEELLRRRCLMYLEKNAERWHYEARDKPWCDVPTNPTPQEIIAVIGSMYALERASLSSPYDKKEVSKFIVATSVDAVDDDTSSATPRAVGEGGEAASDDDDVPYDSTVLIGWDPKNEPPPTNQSELCKDCGQRSDRDRKMCQTCGKQLDVVSNYRIFSNSLINTFYADNVAMPFGGHDYRTIFMHLPVLRPYKMWKFTDITWDHFWQECYLVTHIIFTLSNWGELSLDAKLFVHEYEFIKRIISIHLEQNDVHLVAECLECLKILGDDDNDPKVREAMEWLLAAQDVNDGSWDPVDASPYDKFHATMCACQTLMVHKRRGHGPGIVNVFDLLYKWHTEDMMNVSMRASYIRGMSSVGMSMDPRGRKFVHMTDNIMLGALSEEESRARGLARITVGGETGETGETGGTGTNGMGNDSKKNDKISKKETSSPSITQKDSTRSNESTNKSDGGSGEKKKVVLEKFKTVEQCLAQLEKLTSALDSNDADALNKKYRSVMKKMIEFDVPTDVPKVLRLTTTLRQVRTFAMEHNNDKLQEYANYIFAYKLTDTFEGQLCRAVAEVKRLVENKDFLSDDEVNEQLLPWHTKLIPNSIYTQVDLTASGAIKLVKAMKKSTKSVIQRYGTYVYGEWKTELKAKGKVSNGKKNGSEKKNTKILKNTTKVAAVPLGTQQHTSTDDCPRCNGKHKAHTCGKQKEKKTTKNQSKNIQIQNSNTRKRPRNASSSSLTSSQITQQPVVKKTKTKSKVYHQPQDYIGAKVKVGDKFGTVLRFFAQDEDDEAVWRIVFDGGGDDELEEDELKKSVLLAESF